MERIVTFRDYQEQVADDHNNIQNFARESIDDIVKDIGTNARGYSELLVSKTGQVEVTVAPGRIYDGGAVYKRRTSFSQSMATYTAAAARRIVAVSAYGLEVQTDNEQRDFVVDVATRATEPRAVPMTTSREVQVVFTSGAEAADPTPPAVPATHVVIAYILMDTTQVISVTMQSANEVESTASLNQRASSLETFRTQIEPRVTSLASDLSSLAIAVKTSPTTEALGRVMLDLARVKTVLKFPNNASGYNSYYYLDQSYSDMTNAANLGFDARVEEGVRFPTANAQIFPISLFAANDPNAKVVSGLLLPAYTEELKIKTGSFTSDLGIAQYGFQTFQTKTGYISQSRLRYGGSYTECSNGVAYNTPGNPVSTVGLYDFNTQAIQVVGDIVYDDPTHQNNHQWAREDTWWFDQWKEPFNYTVTVDNSISGAFVGQTILISNDMWMTKLGFYISAKGANEDIKVVLCEVTNGTPDLSKVMQTITYPHASIVNGMNYVSVKPTFFQKGKRLAVALVSNANHKIGMTSGQNYLDGTFFYSTDQIYYQGDLTKDMVLEIHGARFNAPQVTIEFAPLNLDGGIRDIDILCSQWAPESTQLIYEIRPNGTGEWQPLTRENLTALGSAPPLCQFRARFVGTRDMQPAIQLTGARVTVSRPKTSFKYVSTPETIPASSTITVKIILERFEELPHDFDLSLYVTAGPSGTLPRTETADSVVTKLVDDTKKRYERTFVFNTAAPVTAFRFVMTGTTNTPVKTFHVAINDYFSL